MGREGVDDIHLERFAGAEGVLGVFARGDVGEKDGDLVAAVAAEAEGIEVEPTMVHTLGKVDEADGLAS